MVKYKAGVFYVKWWITRRECSTWNGEIQGGSVLREIVKYKEAVFYVKYKEGAFYVKYKEGAFYVKYKEGVFYVNVSSNHVGG